MGGGSWSQNTWLLFDDSQKARPQLEQPTTLLFGLADVRVERVVLLPDGTRGAHVRTACRAVAGCPMFGVISSSVKGNVTTMPRDIPYGTGRIAVV